MFLNYLDDIYVSVVDVVMYSKRCNVTFGNFFLRKNISALKTSDSEIRMLSSRVFRFLKHISKHYLS